MRMEGGDLWVIRSGFFDTHGNISDSGTTNWVQQLERDLMATKLANRQTPENRRIGATLKVFMASLVILTASAIGMIGPSGSVFGPDPASAWPAPYRSCTLTGIGSPNHSSTSWSTVRYRPLGKITNRVTISVTEYDEKPNRSTSWMYYNCGATKFKRLRTISSVSERYRTCKAEFFGNVIVSRRNCSSYTYVWSTASPRITYGSWIRR